MLSLYPVVQQDVPEEEQAIDWPGIGSYVPTEDLPPRLVDRLRIRLDPPGSIQVQVREGPIWEGADDLPLLRDSFRAFILPASPETDLIFPGASAISNDDAEKFVDWTDAPTGGHLPADGGARVSRADTLRGEGRRRYVFLKGWALQYMRYLRRAPLCRAIQTVMPDGTVHYEEDGLASAAAYSALQQAQAKRYAPADKNKGDPDHRGGFNPDSLLGHSRLAYAMQHGEATLEEIWHYLHPTGGLSRPYAVGYTRIQGLRGNKFVFELADLGGPIGARRVKAVSGYYARARPINAVPMFLSLPARGYVGWLFGLMRRTRHHAVDPACVAWNLHGARCRSGDYSGFDQTVDAVAQLAVGDAAQEFLRETAGPWLNDRSLFAANLAELLETYASIDVLHGRVRSMDGGFMENGGRALRSGTPDTSVLGNLYNGTVHFAYAGGARSISDQATEARVARATDACLSGKARFSIMGDDTVNNYGDQFLALLTELGHKFSYVEGLDFLKTIYSYDIHGRAITTGHLGSLAINRCFKEERFLPEDVKNVRGELIATRDQVAALALKDSLARLTNAPAWRNRLAEFVRNGPDRAKAVWRITESMSAADARELAQAISTVAPPRWYERGGLFAWDVDQTVPNNADRKGGTHEFNWQAWGEAAKSSGLSWQAAATLLKEAG